MTAEEFSETPRQATPRLLTPAMVLSAGIALSLLLASAGLAYRYIVYLPERDRAAEARLAAEQARADAKAAQDRLDQREQTRRREEKYQACLADAQLTYSSNWNRSCASLAADRARQFDECKSTRTAEVCAVWYPQLPTFDCRLSTYVADRWNTALEQEKKRCLEEVRAGLS